MPAPVLAILLQATAAPPADPAGGILGGVDLTKLGIVGLQAVAIYFLVRGLIFLVTAYRDLALRKIEEAEAEKKAARDDLRADAQADQKLADELAGLKAGVGALKAQCEQAQRDQRLVVSKGG